MEITEFRAGGSVDLESACLNHNSNSFSVDLEKVAVVNDIGMNMGSDFGFVANDSSINNLAQEEATRPPLVELSTNQHEEGYNQTSSMDIKIQNIAKANLKRIDPQARLKKTDSDGDALPPDKLDEADTGNSLNDQGVEMTQKGICRWIQEVLFLSILCNFCFFPLPLFFI